MSGGTLTLHSGGNDTGNGTADSCSLLWISTAGDFDISARVVSVNAGGGDSGDTNYSQGGLMARETVNSDSRMECVGISLPGSGNGFRSRLRKTTTGTAVSNGSDASVTLPYYVRMVKTHDATHSYFDVYRSSDGISWGASIGGDNIPALIDPMLVGFWGMTLTNTGITTVVFDNIFINGAQLTVSAAAPDPVPSARRRLYQWAWKP